MLFAASNSTYLWLLVGRSRLCNSSSVSKAPWSCEIISHRCPSVTAASITVVWEVEKRGLIKKRIRTKGVLLSPMKTRWKPLPAGSDTPLSFSTSQMWKSVVKAAQRGPAFSTPFWNLGLDMKHSHQKFLPHSRPPFPPPPPTDH